MKTTFFILISIILTPCFGQQFEGKIIYQNSYKSKSETPSEYLNQLFGKTHTYQIKNGNYKLESDGKLLQWQIYIMQEDKLFSKLAASKKVGIKDLSKEFDKVKNVKVKRQFTVILNHTCDEFIVRCKNSTQKYYMDSSLTVSPEVFKTSTFNHRFSFLSKNQIFPLKMIIEDETSICESTEVEMKAEKIDESIFTAK